jgi:hypothetical protein
MPKILLMGNHTDAELREFIRIMRAELLRRRQARAAKKYLEKHGDAVDGADGGGLEPARAPR